MNEVLENAAEFIKKRMYSQAVELLQGLSVKQLLPEEKIEYEYLMGICFFETSTIDAAIKKFENCIEIAKNNALNYYLANIYYEISLAYFKLHIQNASRIVLEHSINYCKQALDISVNNSIITKTSGLMIYADDSPEAYINMLIHLGVLYQTKNDLDESIKILLVSKAICQHFSKLDLLGQVYDELGTSYMMLGKLELAGYYFIKSVNVKAIINNSKGIEISIKKHMLCALSNPESLESEEALRLRNLISEERI